MRLSARVLAFSLLLAAPSLVLAQEEPWKIPAESADFEVHLEAHDGQTRFALGDLIRVDLVFEAHVSGYTVMTDPNTLSPLRDEVEVTPSQGWVVSHVALTSHEGLVAQGVNGNYLSDLKDAPVRVPVLLNRTIDFRQPGRYEVTLTTDRVIDSAVRRVYNDCRYCRKSNALAITLIASDEKDEESLVQKLTGELADALKHPPMRPTENERQEVLATINEAQGEANKTKSGSLGDLSEDQQKAFQRKLEEASEHMMKSVEQRQAAQREAVLRLAYLHGDAAMRAKVNFILEAQNVQDGEDLAAMMLDGLASSRNVQLQADLLDTAWRDPEAVPTFELQDALRQAKELARGQRATSTWGASWTQADSLEIQKQYHELVMTLPQRSTANRDATARFLLRYIRDMSDTDRAQLKAWGYTPVHNDGVAQ